MEVAALLREFLARWGNGVQDAENTTNAVNQDPKNIILRGLIGALISYGTH